MSRRTLVYTAGPITDTRGFFYYEKNIREAEAIAQQLWVLGYAVICPHTNTRNFDGIVTFQDFSDGDLEMMRRCDAVIFTPRWKESKGATIEHDFCVANNIPRYYWPDHPMLPKDAV